jgi:SWI/SNF-related matrix-associated actin-dependent regulator 1 of chromatin subfamily A
VNGEELRDRLAFRMIRRTKKEVLKDLPDLQRALLTFDLTKEDWKAYLEEETEVLNDPDPMTHVMKLWHEVGRVKRQVAGEWATNFLQETDEKLVVFAHHKDVVEYLLNNLTKFGSTSITGDTSQKERDKRQQKFQESMSPRVMVVSLAASEGIDLWKASNILYTEIPWVPAQVAQIESRCHRQGQKNAVTSWVLIANDTVDEHIWAVLKHKEALYEQLLKVDWTEETVKQEVISRMRQRRKHGRASLDVG